MITTSQGPCQFPQQVLWQSEDVIVLYLEALERQISDLRRQTDEVVVGQIDVT